MNLLILTACEQAIIERSVAHALPDELTPAAAAWGHGVTDLDIARLMMRIERGSIIVPSAVSAAWFALNEIERERHLTRIVHAAIRKGIAYSEVTRTGTHTVRTQLLAAPVHLRAGLNGTVCPESREKPYGRYRTLSDVTLVDCSDCILAASAIKQAY